MTIYYGASIINDLSFSDDSNINETRSSVTTDPIARPLVMNHPTGMTHPSDCDGLSVHQWWLIREGWIFRRWCLIHPSVMTHASNSDEFSLSDDVSISDDSTISDELTNNHLRLVNQWWLNHAMTFPSVKTCHLWLLARSVITRPSISAGWSVRPSMFICNDLSISDHSCIRKWWLSHRWLVHQCDLTINHWWLVNQW